MQALRIAFFPSDVDVFQALEKDPNVKRRFEEAASSDLQQGWDREKGGVSENGGGGDGHEEEEKREKEMSDLLKRRGHGEDVIGEGDGGDVDRVLSRGFGDVKVT